MKNKRLVSIILALAISAVSMMGCQKTTQVNETKYFKLDIDGEKEYFAEESSEVKEVKEFIDTFLNVAVNNDYTRSDEEIVENLYLYTDEVIASDEEYGYVDFYLETQKERQLIRTLLEYEIIEIDYYKMFGKDYANITTTDITVISNASEEYMESANIKLNQKYKTNRQYRILKQDNGWRIQDVIYVQDRVEVE